MTNRKFYVHTYTFVLLSEDPTAGTSLEEALDLAMNGPCSGDVTSEVHEEVDGVTMAVLLAGQRSAPAFFGLTHEGEDVD